MKIENINYSVKKTKEILNYYIKKKDCEKSKVLLVEITTFYNMLSNNPLEKIENKDYLFFEILKIIGRVENFTGHQINFN